MQVIKQTLVEALPLRKDTPAVPGSLAARSATKLDHTGPSYDIIDIRRDTEELDLKRDVRELIDPKDGGPRQLPTLLLYDEKGLQLFEEVRRALPLHMPLSDKTRPIPRSPTWMSTTSQIMKLKS
jgi:hypothetical protein